MIYRKDNNIYFKIKKNMSSTIVDQLTTQEWKCIATLPPDWKDCYKFTMLREPIDRFVSGYITVVIRDLPWKEMAWDTEEVMLKFLKELKKRNRAVSGHRDCLNYHVATQVSFLPVKMDYYAIQEELPESWEDIFATTGLRIPGSKNVRDKETKDKIRALLTPKILKIIKKIYKKDIKLYDKYKTR
jgi:hypothetical protein